MRALLSIILLAAQTGFVFAEEAPLNWSQFRGPNGSCAAAAFRPQVKIAGDTFELLHANRLAGDDMCMATPAVAGDRLLIRTAVRLYCLGKTGP